MSSYKHDDVACESIDFEGAVWKPKSKLLMLSFIWAMVRFDPDFRKKSKFDLPPLEK